MVCQVRRRLLQTWRSKVTRCRDISLETGLHDAEHPAATGCRGLLEAIDFRRQQPINRQGGPAKCGGAVDRGGCWHAVAGTQAAPMIQNGSEQLGCVRNGYPDVTKGCSERGSERVSAVWCGGAEGSNAEPQIVPSFTPSSADKALQVGARLQCVGCAIRIRFRI